MSTHNPEQGASPKTEPVYFPKRESIEEGSARVFLTPFMIAAINASFTVNQGKAFDLVFDQKTPVDGDKFYCKTDIETYTKKVPMKFLKLKGRDISHIWSLHGVEICKGSKRMADRVYQQFLMFCEAYDQGFRFGDVTHPSTFNEISTALNRDKSGAPHEMTETRAVGILRRQLGLEILKQKQDDWLFTKFDTFRNKNPELVEKGIYAIPKTRFYPMIEISAPRYDKPVFIAIQPTAKPVDSAYELWVFNPKASRIKIYKKLCENGYQVSDFFDRGSDMRIYLNSYKEAIEVARYIEQYTEMRDDVDSMRLVDPEVELSKETPKNKPIYGFRHLGRVFIGTLKFKAKNGMTSLQNGISRHLA